jgi:hypothetical protein
MSRTDHHRPYWVRVGDPQESRVAHHDHTPRPILCVTEVIQHEETFSVWGTWEQRTRRWTERKGYRVALPVECDIEDFTPQGPRWRWRRDATRCDYSLADERPFHHVPKDVRRDYWYGPDRARSRDACRDLLRAYNAHGEVEDADPPAWQHRHETSWWYY